MDEVTGDFELGDSVIVREGVRHPQLDYDIGGWQGRVMDAETSEPFGLLLSVEWDSITLRNMPRDFFEEADEAGIDWTRAFLLPKSLVATQPRDDEGDAMLVAEELSDLYESEGYVEEEDELGMTEPEQRIAAILSGAKNKKEELERWAEVMSENLTFPFNAEVVIFQEQGPLQEGDKVEVDKISLIDEEHGIIVSVRHQGNHYDFPLADLEVEDDSASNFQLVDDFAIWYDDWDAD